MVACGGKVIRHRAGFGIAKACRPQCRTDRAAAKLDGMTLRVDNPKRQAGPLSVHQERRVQISGSLDTSDDHLRRAVIPRQYAVERLSKFDVTESTHLQC